MVKGVLDSLLSEATSSDSHPSCPGESPHLSSSLGQGGVAFSKGVSSYDETTDEVNSSSVGGEDLSMVSEIRLKGGRKTSSTPTLFYWNENDEICGHLFTGNKFCYSSSCSVASHKKNKADISAKLFIVAQKARAPSCWMSPTISDANLSDYQFTDFFSVKTEYESEAQLEELFETVNNSSAPLETID